MAGKNAFETSDESAPDNRAHWSSVFPRIPLWLFSLTLAVFVLILMERLYISHAPMSLFGSTIGPMEPGELIAPSGSILIWYSKEKEIPRGWVPCDGTDGTPNLDERFLMGVVARNRIGETGGSKDISSDGEHVHAGETESVVGMPQHGIPCSGKCGARPGNHTHTFVTKEAGKHSHGDNRPPYYGIMFLCRK